MKMLPRRRRETQFQRAAEGSMTLLEHLRELRSRLFKASLAVLIGMIAGFIVSERVIDFLTHPYCALMIKMNSPTLANGKCMLQQTGITDAFTLKMQIALWIGLILAGPVWLYQLWAFIAPGLHRHERRWAYLFAGIAAPLFAFGTVMAYFIITRGMEFLFTFTPKDVLLLLEFTGYVKFITSFMLIIGVAFEFPLVVMLLNVAGAASARRLMGWWRVAVFLLFAFAAVAVPLPDPFTMSLMGAALTSLYFGAVLFAYLNDRRRARLHRIEFGDLDDDEASPLEFDIDQVEAGAPIEPIEPVEPPEPVSRSRYDDMT